MPRTARPRRHGVRAWAVAGGAAALVILPVADAAGATRPKPSSPTLPVPRSTVDPATAVGGARLASMGVVTDLPKGVPAPPTMRDVAWVVADLDTGEVIAAKAPHARLAPASTLKTLASIVLLPRIDASRSYAAAASDTRADGTRIGLVPGQVYTGRQLFQALLMGSANDAAYMLARINGGTARTLAQMNAEARELGALDTRAGDPSGLDAPGQTSSAYDLALIARKAMQSKAFRSYVQTRRVHFPGMPVPKKAAKHTSASGTPKPGPTLVDAKGIHRQTYDLTTHTTIMLNYPGAIGGKDGYTSKANRTYIAVARRGGHTYVVTEMWGLDFQQWRPTAKLLDWAFAYGSKARPVGRLVEPGELSATPSPAGQAGATSPADTVTTPPPGPTDTLLAAAAPQALTTPASGRDDNLVPALLGAAVLAAGGALGVGGVLRARRREARGEPRH